MRAFVTGATGFIGGRVASRLRARGDDVVALVRNPEKARGLEAEVVQGDLTDAAAIRRGLEGCDACFHIAADYRVGLPKAKHNELVEANVGGTERVLDAAADAGVARTVYVSTVNVFGDTKGQVVDESYRRDEGDGFLSVYDETKYRAHQIALEHIAKGEPIVIVQPGGVYGPGDHSLVGEQLEQASKGKLPGKALTNLGLQLVHVDDVADGILLAYDRGQVGESYVLAAERTTLGDAIDLAARIGGNKPPRLSVPTPVLKAIAPLAPVIGKPLGFPPNLREAISAADGVTYWASDAKAREQLGFEPRDLETGLRETLGTRAAAS